MKTTYLGLTAAALLSACATTQAPNELITARAAYNRTAQGPAAQVNPAEVHEAHNALNRAEQKFLDEGDTENAKNLAYIAERRAQLAETVAQGQQANQQVKLTAADLEKRKDSELANAKSTVNAQQQTLGVQQQKIADEQSKRIDAEKRAAQAAADLARIASVKQEPRGMVITLSGSVLFASGQSTLLPEAQTRLSQVADALSKTDPDSKIVVQGHTDSQGSASFNTDLSQKRAEAVRSFLTSHGVANDRVSAQGFGPTQSIADNNSAEGRANNRRVEIVVQPTSTR